MKPIPILALLCAALAATMTASPHVLAAEGEALFRTACASCHGLSGKGDGYASSALSPRPSDLTKSTLSVTELAKVIDGRRTVRAHGDAAMPVWGTVFEESLEGTGREHRDSLRTVIILADYVRSLQAGGESEGKDE